VHAAEQERPDVAEARAQWHQLQPKLDPTKLIFLDETWTTTNMARLYGRCPRGERLIAAIPHGHRMTTTFLAGLRCDGVIAPLVLDGPINGEIFLSYIEQFLAPALLPGQIVIMDNLSAHKVAGVRETIEAADAELRYLPAYSPDLNPIENMFAKLKAMLRKAAERNVDDLWDRIGELAGQITQAESHGYFRHAGYVFESDRGTL